MTGIYVRLADLSDEEFDVFFAARRLRRLANFGPAVARSVTDTSAAARRKLSPYDGDDFPCCASDGERVES